MFHFSPYWFGPFSSRMFHWRLTLYLILWILIVVIPLCIPYSLLRSFTYCELFFLQIIYNLVVIVVCINFPFSPRTAHNRHFGHVLGRLHLLLLENWRRFSDSEPRARWVFDDLWIAHFLMITCCFMLITSFRHFHDWAGDCPGGHNRSHLYGRPFRIRSRQRALHLSDRLYHAGTFIRSTWSNRRHSTQWCSPFWASFPFCSFHNPWFFPGGRLGHLTDGAQD